MHSPHTQGIAGVPGKDGIPGIPGRQGDPGVKGPLGEPGDKGMKGYQGYPGKTGPEVRASCLCSYTHTQLYLQSDVPLHTCMYLDIPLKKNCVMCNTYSCTYIHIYTYMYVYTCDAACDSPQGITGRKGPPGQFGEDGRRGPPGVDVRVHAALACCAYAVCVYIYMQLNYSSSLSYTLYCRVFPVLKEIWASLESEADRVSPEKM